MRRLRFSIFGRQWSTFRCYIFRPLPKVDRLESMTIVRFLWFGVTTWTERRVRP
jgi:hypothetical protein